MTTKLITIRKKSLWRRAMAAMAIIVVAAAVWTGYRCIKKRNTPTVVVEVCSRNVLTAGNREVAYFRSIGADSTFTGLTLYADSVKTAPPIQITPSHLKAVIRHTIKQIEDETEDLEAADKEMVYYLGTHGVQDEGYDMIAAHQNDIHLRVEHNKRLATALTAVIDNHDIGVKRVAIKREEHETSLSPVFVKTGSGRWAGGRWTRMKGHTHGIALDIKQQVVCGIWNADTLVGGRRTDSCGIYNGEMNSAGIAMGHGSYDRHDGTYYEGHWKADKRDGFGFSVDRHKLKAGEWKADRYIGERLHYTSERIYGIDISKYQHGKGRKHYPILWDKLRISHLGHISNKTVSGRVDYPVSFVYIKSTEGASVRNPYFMGDYQQARKHGIRTGAYHFFSVRTPAAAQAYYFLKYSAFRQGDMPPVLDVEPTDEQIKRIGGAGVLFSHIRTWMSIVKNRTGMKPVLYVSQRFVNKYLVRAADIKQNYNVWIARYGEYKPDVRLVYWQLCPDGRVNGIHGEVDINVFNGYKDKFNEFLSSETKK